jgi:DNA-binding SARP family transcriptional activator
LPVAVEAEFSLLGPLQVRRGGVLVPVAPGGQPVLLAAPLLHAGHVLPVDQLIDVLWDGGPPPTARASLQNYVSRLRKALVDLGCQRITTHPNGYLITVEPGGLDLTRFEDLLTAARVAAREGSWETAGGQARAALALWRGEPLADTGSQGAGRARGGAAG